MLMVGCIEERKLVNKHVGKCSSPNPRNNSTAPGASSQGLAPVQAQKAVEGDHSQAYGKAPDLNIYRHLLSKSIYFSQTPQLLHRSFC